MTTQEALQHLRETLGYYSVTHDAHCRSSADKYDEHLLNGCDCDTGRAFRHIQRKLRTLSKEK